MDDEKLVDTSKLKEGMIVKNYKELCKLVGEEIKSGSAKKAQVYNWSRFFDFEKQEHKNSYAILKIHETPIKGKPDRGRPSIYVKDIEEILLDYLSRQKNYSDTLTKKKWMYILGMCNISFVDIMHPDESNNFQLGLIIGFCKRKQWYLNGILNNILRSLKNKNLISWTTKYVLYRYNEECEPSNEELQTIKSIENYIKRIMGYDTIKEIFDAHRQNEYYKRISDDTKQALKCDALYKRIKITYCADNVPPQRTKEYIAKKKLEVNQKIVDTITNKEYQDAISPIFTEEYWNKRLELINTYFKITPETAMDEVQINEQQLFYEEDDIDFVDITDDEQEI